MGIRSDILEIPLWAAGKLVASKHQVKTAPESIFILRNNDIGDLLVTSPLFEALKLRYPSSKLVVAVGPWNTDTLKNNPYVDEVVVTNAPWCNRTAYGLSQAQIYANSLRYIFGSAEARALRNRKFSVGIDVFGSQHGSIFLLFLGIPLRLGVKGCFAGGGASACQLSVNYDHFEHVSRQNLRFAELLNSTTLPEARPQIFLTDDERAKGVSLWKSNMRDSASDQKRIVIAPGAGHPSKSWDAANYIDLARRLASESSACILVVGGPGDADVGSKIAAASPNITNICGKVSMRESFSVVANSDLVFSNSSMVMHVAGAFKKPQVVLLSEAFKSGEQHQAQWGYSETCVCVGMTTNCPRPATVQEAVDAGLRLLNHS